MLHRSRAFTLVELLVVISIVALLIAILLASLARARRASQQVACMSNMRQIQAAMQMYRQDNRDFIPYAYNVNPADPSDLNYGGTNYWCGWVVRLLEKKYLSLGVLRCPSDARPFPFQIVGSNPVMSYGINEWLSISLPLKRVPRTLTYPGIEALPLRELMPIASDAYTCLLNGYDSSTRAVLANAGYAWDGGPSTPITAVPSLKRHPGGSVVLFADGRVALVTQAQAMDPKQIHYTDKSW